jgi:phosphoribosylformimino-5-aminoimidazole carboxamide ribotide isomerase
LIVYPAIDIRGGKCVRLIKGDYSRELVYGDDPADVAERWQAAGARVLHLVDLDAAKSGQPTNLATIERIRQRVTIDLQVGGGIRDEAIIQRYLDLGVRQLVVGTQAVRQPEWFAQMTHRFPACLVAGIDAHAGQVATDGWTQASGQTPVAMAQSLERLPLAAIVYTDIATDGMLQGPNVSAMAQMAAAVAVPIIASGGVTRPDDVRRLAEAGVAGCIVGRTLYEGHMTLEEALTAAESAQS